MMRATQPARFLISACLTLLFFTWTVPLNASITMTGTRIIYNGSVKSTDVHLKNKDAIPYVVQTWFDNGNMADGPEKYVQVPFIATPPAFRIQPGEGQVIRIVYTQAESLPQDRETLVWFNFMQVPPANIGQQKAGAESQNSLLIMLRNRVKLFYRPVGLSGNPQKMLENLQVSRTRRGNQFAVAIKNNQPYYITVAGLQLSNAANVLRPTNDMIAPFTSETYVFARAPHTEKARVRITLINDQGARISEDYPL